MNKVNAEIKTMIRELKHISNDEILYFLLMTLGDYNLSSDLKMTIVLLAAEEFKARNGGVSV